MRNDLDVVLAHADRIDDEELRTGIRDRATDLLEISTKARDVEELMTASTGTPETVDLAAVATRVVERFRIDDHPGSVALESQDAVRIASHRPVVERILAELVENGLVHSDAADPSVEVRVREGPDAAAELVVADDGPGLPDRVREMLTTGTETPLNHGHGIGLWFVNWAVTQLGGELRFRETDAGTVVTITFYDMDHDLAITG